MKIISKNSLIIYLIIILLLASVYLNISTIQQNKKYENYLTQEIGNTLRPMGSSIETGNEMLENALNDGSISGRQLIDLFFIFEGFTLKHQDLGYLAYITQDRSISIPENTWDFSRYLNQMINENSLWLHQVAETEEVISLNAEHLITFRQVQSVTERYKEIFVDYEDWDYSVTNEHWIIILDKILDADRRFAN